jgi:hypothetical protein
MFEPFNELKRQTDFEVHLPDAFEFIKKSMAKSMLGVQLAI